MAEGGKGRDYDRAAGRLQANGSREQRILAVVDALWEELSGKGVSWVGFYVKSPDGDEMLLGPCRDKPACSPIGLHGACGQAFRSGKPRVVRDVKELGQDYVACDPRDRSEVVLPVCDESGDRWGVLDLDSHELAAFDEADVTGLQRVLERAGFRVG